MPRELVVFIVWALIAGVGLWGLGKVPQIDGGVKTFVSIAVYGTLAIWLIIIVARLFGVNVIG